MGSGSVPAEVTSRLDALRDQQDDAQIRARFHELVDHAELPAMLARAPAAVRSAQHLGSSEAGFFADLLPMARDEADRLAVRLFDAMLEADEVAEYARTVDQFGSMCRDAIARRGRIYVICWPPASRPSPRRGRSRSARWCSTTPRGSRPPSSSHGPNTILGFNTVLGPLEVDAMLRRLGESLQLLAARAAEAGLGTEFHEAPLAGRHRLGPVTGAHALLAGPRRAGDLRADGRPRRDPGELYADYPLIYTTGPEERDVALTVSQINTHKIRGACTVVIAEEHPALRGLATKAPVDNPEYCSVYVTLPWTNDTLMAMFSATVALQRLALKMSLLKKHYLDRRASPTTASTPTCRRT